MKPFFCPICKEVTEVVNERSAHDNVQIELYCEPCDALIEITYDDRLPTRLEGSD